VWAPEKREEANPSPTNKMKICRGEPMCLPKSLQADTQVCPYLLIPLLSKERVRVRFKKK